MLYIYEGLLLSSLYTDNKELLFPAEFSSKLKKNHILKAEWLNTFIAEVWFWFSILHSCHRHATIAKDTTDAVIKNTTTNIYNDSDYDYDY